MSNYPPIELFSTGPWQNLLITIYSSTSIVSLCLNVVTFVVLLRNKLLFAQIRLHLITLCIVDLLMATFYVPTIYLNFLFGRWILPHFLCPIAPVGQTLFLSVSSWTLLALTIELYFVTFHHDSCILQWIQSHRMLQICLIWILGSLAAGPLVLKSHVEQFIYYENAFADCRETTTQTHATVLFGLIFVAPVVMQIFVFTRMRFFGSNQDQNEEMLNVRSIIIVLVTLFALFWLPLQILLQISIITRYYSQYYIYYFLACHWLSMAHTMLNPIVYFCMSNAFKKSIKRMLCLKVDQEQHEASVENQLQLTEQ